MPRNALLDESAVQQLLERRLAHGTARALAEKLGISPQYLSDVRRGRQAPGPKLLMALGLVRTVTYVGHCAVCDRIFTLTFRGTIPSHTVGAGKTELGTITRCAGSNRTPKSGSVTAR
mgnify:CR=1 FL=1